LKFKFRTTLFGVAFLIGNGERVNGLETTAFDFVNDLDTFRRIGDKELVGVILKGDWLGNLFNGFTTGTP
jgi:hypothetical protein